jgi:hypothetical protein
LADLSEHLKQIAASDVVKEAFEFVELGHRLDPEFKNKFKSCTNEGYFVTIKWWMGVDLGNFCLAVVWDLLVCHVAKDKLPLRHTIYKMLQRWPSLQPTHPDTKTALVRKGDMIEYLVCILRRRDLRPAGMTITAETENDLMQILMSVCHNIFDRFKALQRPTVIPQLWTMQSQDWASALWHSIHGDEGGMERVAYRVQWDAQVPPHLVRIFVKGSDHTKGMAEAKGGPVPPVLLTGPVEGLEAFIMTHNMPANCRGLPRELEALNDFLLEEIPPPPSPSASGDFLLEEIPPPPSPSALPPPPSPPAQMRRAGPKAPPPPLLPRPSSSRETEALNDFLLEDLPPPPSPPEQKCRTGPKAPPPSPPPRPSSST